MNFKFG